MSEALIKTMLPSSDGNHRLAVYSWLPRNTPSGIIQIVHGMREHMGRYADFAAYFNRHGYAVCGHDHLGHGETASTSGDFGYFGEKSGAGLLVDDCAVVGKYLQNQYPGLPVILLGHSMGSFIGRLYILRVSTPLAGFICMGTGGENPAAPMARTAAELLALVAGASPARLLDRLSFSGYLKRFAGEDSAAWISRDAAVSKAFLEDEFTRPLFTNRGFCDLLDLQMAATSRQWAGRVDKSLPILLVSGGEDPVGNYGRGVVQTLERLGLAGVKDVSCRIYKGARHEILNEINKEEVYYDLLSWINKHVANSAEDAARGGRS